jgi:hypothetical protein
MTLAVLIVTLGKSGAIRKRLRTEGLKGTGQVLALQTTGVRVNDQPQLALTMHVTVHGRDPFMIRHSEVVNEIRIPQVQPGAMLPILVDPKDPTLFVINWDG